MTQQNKLSNKRIPCLDGVRAISISFVLIAHFVGTVHRDLTKWIGHHHFRNYFIISAVASLDGNA